MEIVPVVFLFFLALIMAFVAAELIRNPTERDVSASGIAGLLIGSFVFFLLSFGFCFDNGFKKGQIEAITGKISYKLKVGDDGTSNWERIVKCQPECNCEHHEGK